MARTTSRKAYEHLVRTGQLVGKQARCLSALIDLGTATSGEVLWVIGVANVNAWRARFTELQARGLIVEAGERRCQVSGLRCIVWRPTGRMKPLDVKRGARAPSGKVWKTLALELWRVGWTGREARRPGHAHFAEQIRRLGGAP